MQLRDALLEEFDLEMEYVRKHLERVPEGKDAWKPAGKSMPLGWLATFLAILPTWGVDVLAKDEFDVSPKTGSGTRPALPGNNAERLAMFDANVKGGREALARMTEAQLEQPWSLKAAGNTLWTRPKWLVLRTFFLNHAIHHRAQLGVYLRLLEIPVPAVYNDSADEKGGMFRD